MVAPPPNGAESDDIASLEEWNALMLLLQYSGCTSTTKMDEIEVVFIQRGSLSDDLATVASVRYLAGKAGRKTEFYTFGGTQEVEGIYESGSSRFYFASGAGADERE